MGSFDVPQPEPIITGLQRRAIAAAVEALAAARAVITGPPAIGFPTKPLGRVTVHVGIEVTHERPGDDPIDAARFGASASVETLEL